MTSTKEKIKNVLICILLIGMVYLTYAVWFYDSPFGELRVDSFFDFSVSQETRTGKDSDLDRFGIRPLAVVITDENGRRGAIYSSDKSDELYFGVRSDVAQSLRRAKSFSEADISSWERAIAGAGVFLDYRTDIPLSAVRMWLGSFNGDESIHGRYYVFSAEKRNITIYVKNAENGKIYFAQTDVSSEQLRESMALLSCEQVRFGAEREEEDYRVLMAETVLPEVEKKLPILSAYNSVVNFSTETSAAALEVFGLSDVAPEKYAEQDGTEVYIADRVTLKISPDGELAYTDTREEADDILGIPVESDFDVPTLAEKTEAARKLTATLASKLPGEGGIYIASVSEGTNGTEVIFGRHVGGVPVDMRETLYFSSVLIKGRSVRSARFNLRGYEKTPKLSSYVPERIVAAAVKGAGETGDINLRYRDSGENEISFAWYIGGIERESKKEA